MARGYDADAVFYAAFGYFGAYAVGYVDEFGAGCGADVHIIFNTTIKLGKPLDKLFH
jgi:hypothetical protein